MSAAQRVGAALLALWVGSLWSLALWVAPTLFYAQPDKHLAGVLAAQLFGIETYLGLGLGVLAFCAGRTRQFAAGFAAVALLAVNEWAVKPLMTRAHVQGAALGLGFGAWHGVAALLYLGACLAALWLLWKAPAASWA
jgi:hypothetical protein